MEKSINFLGLIKKAGKLEIGAKSVKAAVKAGKAKLILSAADAAQDSMKQAKKAAELGKVQHVILPFEKVDIGSMIGRGLPGMLAITDAGFAAAFTMKLDADFPKRYDKAVKILEETKGKGNDTAAVVEVGKRRI